MNCFCLRGLKGLVSKLWFKKDEYYRLDDIPHIHKTDVCFDIPCYPTFKQSCELMASCKPILDIVIEDDINIEAINIKDCYSIRVVNCPKITKVPSMNHFVNLEVLLIKHCNVDKCYTYFPNSLKTLIISYCNMTDFAPSNIPYTLSELNLSFNKLRCIPKVIETLIDSNGSVNINLRNNDFWYTMYSDLSPSLICAATVKELALANRLNIISSVKVQYAILTLKEKKYTEESQWLSKQVQKTIEARKEGTQSTFANSENVHLTSVQDGVATAIDYVMHFQCQKTYTANEAIKQLKSLKVPHKVLTFLNRHVSEPSIGYHSSYKVTFIALFEKVYSIIQESTYKTCLLQVLKDELSDGIDTCLTGQLARLVNTLNGFLPGVVISINKTEELSNSIIALRKRFALLYGNDTDRYIEEAIPAVWQLLEDMCIPENEHGAWLEYV